MLPPLNAAVGAPPVPGTAAAAAPAAPIRSAYFVVTRVDNDSLVLGGGGVAPLLGGAADVCELRKMYFLPEARGRGLGQKLLELLAAHARTQGFKQMYLETESSMKSALALYERNGFRRLDQPMGDTGHHACDVRLIKDL